MKTQLFAFTTAIAMTTSALGAGSLASHDLYRDVLHARHLENAPGSAIRLAQQLTSSTTDPDVKVAAQSQLDELTATDPNAKLDMAIKFLTGTKREIYCEGMGLVEMTGEHADGTRSRLVLQNTSRKMDGLHPARVLSGGWTYELSNGYRPPTSSEAWIVSSAPNSLRVKELRTLPNGVPDDGDYTIRWDDKRVYSRSSSSHGDVKEPVPMYMALDFHFWGNDDLGQRLEFVPGLSDRSETRETGSDSESLILKSIRTVRNRIAMHTTIDSKGFARTYRNCSPVDYKIELARVDDNRFRVKGKIDKRAARSALERQLSDIQSCYQEVLAGAPTLRGSIGLELVVDDRGHLKSWKATKKSFYADEGRGSSERLVNCAVQKIPGWKFPPAASHTTATIESGLRFANGAVTIK